jgi:hypothetical protein
MKLPEMLLDKNTTPKEIMEDLINLLYAEILMEEYSKTYPKIDLDEALKETVGKPVHEIFLNAKNSRDKLIQKEEEWNKIIAKIPDLRARYEKNLTLLEGFIQSLEINIKKDETLLKSLLVLKFHK